MHQYPVYIRMVLSRGLNRLYRGDRGGCVRRKPIPECRVVGSHNHDRNRQSHACGAPSKAPNQPGRPHREPSTDQCRAQHQELIIDISLPITCTDRHTRYDLLIAHDNRRQEKPNRQPGRPIRGRRSRVQIASGTTSRAHSNSDGVTLGRREGENGRPTAHRDCDPSKSHTSRDHDCEDEAPRHGDRKRG